MQTDTVELLRKCKASDEAAIETLVQSYRGSMVRLVLLLLEDPGEVQEAVQDSVISAIRALGAFQGNAGFKTWLTAITLNECRERLKNSQMEKTCRNLQVTSGLICAIKKLNLVLVNRK